MYVIDNVPVIYDPAPGDTIAKSEIEEVKVVKDAGKIFAMGYKNMDAVIFITSKEYAARPDSLKAIATTSAMTKKNGAWFAPNDKKPYTGRFIDYYLNGKKQGEGKLKNGKFAGLRRLYYRNGNVSDEIEYADGIATGNEKQFYKNGQLSLKSLIDNATQSGTVEMYHQNGTLKKRTEYKMGKAEGKTETFYSTGALKYEETYVDGEPVKDKKREKLRSLFSQGIAADKEGNFKTAIKKYSQCIEQDANFADAYYALGTAKLNSMDFEAAIIDFNKALTIEPLFMEVYANRAFALIRKYEFSNSRELSKGSGVVVMATKKAEIPKTDKDRICADLSKAIELGDDVPVVLKAFDEYCKKK